MSLIVRSLAIAYCCCTGLVYSLRSSTLSSHQPLISQISLLRHSDMRKRKSERKKGRVEELSSRVFGGGRVFMKSGLCITPLDSSV